MTILYPILLYSLFFCIFFLNIFTYSFPTEPLTLLFKTRSISLGPWQILTILFVFNSHTISWPFYILSYCFYLKWGTENVLNIPYFIYLFCCCIFNKKNYMFLSHRTLDFIIQNQDPSPSGTQADFWYPV